MAHKPNCSCTQNFEWWYVFISWETMKRRSLIAGMVPECPDQWRFRFAWCRFMITYLLTELVTHTISSRAGWLWKPTKVGIIIKSNITIISFHKVLSALILFRPEGLETMKSLDSDIELLDRPVGTRPSLLEITVGPYVTLCVRSEPETTTWLALFSINLTRESIKISSCGG